MNRDVGSSQAPSPSTPTLAEQELHHHSSCVCRQLCRISECRGSVCLYATVKPVLGMTQKQTSHHIRLTCLPRVVMCVVAASCCDPGMAESASDPTHKAKLSTCK